MGRVKTTPDRPERGGTAGDVLAQPTRARLFALLGEAGSPCSTAELAERLGLHRNGVRGHLERMQQAGLVERARQPRGRGRPPDTWVLTASARRAGGRPERYRELGRWLVRGLASPRRGLRGIEETGREIGRELAAGRSLAGDRGPASSRLPAGDRAAAKSGAEDPVRALESALREMGFAPVVDEPGPATTGICLGNCPYRDAVHQNQAVVCGLHKGITDGLLDVIAPHAKLTGFVPRDPEAAGCTIEVRDLAVAAG